MTRFILPLALAGLIAGSFALFDGPASISDDGGRAQTARTGLCLSQGIGCGVTPMRTGW